VVWAVRDHDARLGGRGRLSVRRQSRHAGASLIRISSRRKATSESRRSRSAARRTRWMERLTANPRTWVSTERAREMTWSVADLAC
jgi:hypothetical protein